MADTRAQFVREIKSFGSNDCFSIFNCSVCYETYLLPKLLENCGHSFCQRCLVSIVESAEDWSGIACPECRTFTSLGPDGVKALKTNVAIQKAIDGFSQTMPKDKETCNNYDICPHTFVSKLVKCPHCDVQFCNGCLLRHCEMLRIEINWFASELEQRVDDAMPLMKTALEKHIRPNNSEENKENLAENEEKSEISPEMIPEIKALVKQQFPGCAELSSDIARINEESILYLSIEDLAEIHAKLSKQNLRTLNLGLGGGLIDLESSPPPNWNHLNENDIRQLIQSLPVDSRLHSAARAGELAQLRQIFTALDHAPSWCRKYVVEHRDKEENGRTMLHQASEHDRLEAVKYLVQEQGADVWAKEVEAGSMPVHLAAIQGHFEVVRFFVEKCSRDLVEAKNLCGDTPLALAAESRHLPLVKYLVEEMKANIENECFFKSTPLLYACSEGHLKVVEFLVEKGANLYARDKYGPNEMTSIHWAVRFGHFDVVKCLLTFKPDLVELRCGNSENTIIHEAAGNDQLEILKFLVVLMGVDTRNGNDWTPLFSAATEGHLECVKFLVERGADLSATAEDGSMPIHSAAYYGCTSVVDYLLDVKPDLINVEDENGDTILELALQEEHDDLVELLKAKGAH